MWAWGEKEGNLAIDVCPYLAQLLHDHPHDSMRTKTNINQKTIERPCACSSSQMLVGVVLPMSLQLALHPFDLLGLHVR